MPVNRALWKRNFTGRFAPSWPCPKCGDGTVQVERDTFHFKETAESRRSHGDEGFSQLGVSFVFSTLLKCGRCAECVSCCGVGGYEPEERQDEEGHPYTDYAPVFYPRYFSTPMRIFLPTKKTPPEVRASIERSFLLFFCDLGAAANHVRQAVEELLSHAGIARTSPGGGFIGLNDRIREFEKRDRDNADRVSALRWIGNFGSHPEELTKDDLFNAYDILEILLEDIYVGHHRQMRDLVARINATKRP